MKFIVERNVLKEALPFVMGRTKGAHKQIPILHHLLIETVERKIRIIGNDLDACSLIEVPADIERPGRIAIPGDRLHHLVTGFPDGSQITIDADATSAKLKHGRSSYQFALMSPDDFPGALTPENPAKMKLTSADVVRLFKQPAPCVLQEQSRPYLGGIYLHSRGGRLAAAATDGHRAIRVFTNVTPPEFKGVIVPDNSLDEIVRIAGEGECDLEIAPNLLAVSANGRRFVTKLIDGTFPDYERVIPQAQTSALTVESKEMDAALGRLVAARSADAKSGTGVKLAWGDDGADFSATLNSEGNTGIEQIECDCLDRPAGQIGANLDYVRSLIDAMGGERIRFFFSDPGSPIRIENPDDDDVVAVLMPLMVR